MDRLNRDDAQYLAIEKFEDYELTYCMAYEMAIRNDEVIKTIYSFYNNYVNDDIYTCYALSTNVFEKCHKDAQKLMEFFINPLGLYLNYHFFKPINEHIKEIKNDWDNEDGNYFSSRINLILFTPNNKHKEYKKFIPKKKLVEQKFTKYYTSFISHQVTKDDENEFTIHHNSITPFYSRPISPWFNEIKERSLNLNLALPTNELVDFIQKVKKDYDRNPSFFGTVKELEGETLKVADKADKALSNQMKLADMLYLYDCLKIGYSKAKIKNTIYNYHADKGIETKNLHHNTLSKYHKIMITYIDNVKYKELILGTK